MAEDYHFGGEIVWRPNQENLENARLSALMRAHGIHDFKTLMQRSIQDAAWFTGALLDFLDIQFFKPHQKALNLSRGIAWPRRWVGGKTNIAHNCLDKYNCKPIIWINDQTLSNNLFPSLHRR